MREKLLWGCLIFLALYMVLPWILTRILGIGVFRKGRASGQIALTFDDGPDPRYTPRLLDLLAKHDVKATFFLLGAKAEKYPELVKRMHEEGHQIGIHNYSHTSNWLMSPWRVRNLQVDRTADIVERLTGERPVYYRPPWGIINVADFFFLKTRYKIILWSVMPRDWRSHIGAQRVKERILRRAVHGSVVLLHDSGETFGADADAPEETLRALEQAIPELLRRGFSCVRVDAMAGMDEEAGNPNHLSLPKRLLVNIWMLWERCFLFLFHVEPVDAANPLLKLRVRKYTGDETITMSDGEEIRKGDQILELHLDNDTLYHMGAEARTSLHLAIQLIRRIEHLLPQVRQAVQTNPAYRDVKGLYGITMVYRGTTQLGFTVVDLPKGIFSSLTNWYLRILMYVIHPQGKSRLKTNREKLVPKIIAMSKKELMSRYAV